MFCVAKKRASAVKSVSLKRSWASDCWSARPARCARPRALLSRYVQLSIEVDSSSRIVDLVHEGYDLAIRVGPLPDSRLAARRLGELHYGLYAAPGYLQQYGTPNTPEELAQHALITFSLGGSRSD